VVADFDSPEAKARLAAQQRRFERQTRIVYWLIGLALAGGGLWSITTSDGPPADPDAYQWVERGPNPR
jgi:hypothetical protein